MTPVRDSRRFISTLEDVLSQGHPVRFRAEGWSMYPAIRNGATITVAPLGREPIRAGDVLLYRQGGRAIVHRVVRVELSSGWPGPQGRHEERDLRLVLRGDAAEACDAPIAVEHVLGRVVAVEHAGNINWRRVPGLRWLRMLGYALRAMRTVKVMLASVERR